MHHVNDSVYNAVDETKPYDNIVYRKARMPNIDDILAQILVTISVNSHKVFFLSSVELNYAAGQVKLHP